MVRVAILMGSESDLEIVQEAAASLRKFGIDWEMRVLSAHRAPRKLAEYVEAAPSRGVQVFICAAGGAAHLAGVVASMTSRPVIGIPVPTTTAQSLDSILSMLQMPAGVPVATVASSKGGAANAGILAAQILALADESLGRRLADHKRELESGCLEKDARLQERLKKPS
jgi:5-(carboxyamino)imidazole ribonucleotide mutase